MYGIHLASPRLRSALLLSPIALLLAPRRALPARRLAALGARGALSTDCWQPVDRIPPAFERRCPRWPLRFTCLRCKAYITECHVCHTFYHSKAALCVAPQPNSAAIGPSSRLASPAPRRSRCSRGFIHGLLAARGQNPPGIRAAMHPRWPLRFTCLRCKAYITECHVCHTFYHSKAALCVAPQPNSAAIGPSSRLASPAPRRSRCSRGFIHGLLAHGDLRKRIRPCGSFMNRSTSSSDCAGRRTWCRASSWVWGWRGWR